MPNREIIATEMVFTVLYAVINKMTTVKNLPHNMTYAKFSTKILDVVPRSSLQNLSTNAQFLFRCCERQYKW